MASTSSILKVRRKCFPVPFLQVEASSECGRLCNNYWDYTDADWAVLCVGHCIENRLLTHIEMFDDANMRLGFYRFFHISLLNDFGSFALCMSDRLFDSAHSSTASPSLSVKVYPQSVLRLLKSPITI